jgi:hypothetical protein
VIQSSCEQQLAVVTYSASVVDWATLDCLREDQEASEDPKNWQVPEVDFRSRRHTAKSASEKLISERKEDAEYQRPISGMYRRYLKICLTACAQTYRKLDVRPHRCHVQEGAHHALVLLLVHGLYVLVRVERCSCTHWCKQGL